MLSIGKMMTVRRAIVRIASQGLRVFHNKMTPRQIAWSMPSTKKVQV